MTRSTKAQRTLSSSRWRDLLPPLRMVLAAVLAYALSAALHLPEGYWAALSAVIVARPQPGAAMQAANGRMIGTLAGAALAFLMSLGRLWDVPDILLLAATLLPLGLLITWRDQYRTAPIAAVIVLAASPAGHGPADAALMRIVEIGLGIAIGMASSWLLLPVRAGRQADALARAVLRCLLGALDAARAGDTARGEALQAEARRCLQTMDRLLPAVRWERCDTQALAERRAALQRLGVSVGFAARTLAAAHRATNPVVADAALAARIAALRPGNGVSEDALANDGTTWVALGAALPSARHREQAQALGYALAMARHDIAALAPAPDGG